MTPRKECEQFRCHRAPKDGDTMCGPHRAGERRSQALREQRIQRNKSIDLSYRMRRNQERYVEQWRKTHPQQHWTPSWACPLCGKAIQSIVADRTGPYAAYGPSSEAVKGHKEGHSDDWSVYEAAYRLPEGPEAD